MKKINTKDTIITNMKGTTTKTLVFTMLFMLLSFSAIAGNKTIKIKTSAICDMCKNRIELVVNSLDGVKKSMLNLENGVLLVKYDTKKISEEQIKIAISETGYHANELERNPKAYSVLPNCCKEGSSCDVKH